MKNTFLFCSFIALLTTTGCIITDGGGHGHGRHEGNAAIIVPVPVVVVPAVRVHVD